MDKRERTCRGCGGNEKHGHVFPSKGLKCSTCKSKEDSERQQDRNKMLRAVQSDLTWTGTDAAIYW